MNGTDRLERELTAWFADTAAPQTPDWTADILAATSTTRQRPRWSFPTRWLPAAIVPRLPRLTVPSVPWRTVALLAALVLLLATAVALYVGSRPRLPAPFGPAANGLVAYAEGGEIWTVDPVTGERNAIVTLPGANSSPRWSRDGTRIAFLQLAAGGQSVGITNADGSGLVVSDTPAFVQADTDSLAWSPDGRFVAVVAEARAPRVLGGPAARTTYLVDTTSGDVRDLDTRGVDTEVYWRPPDGRQLMYTRQTAAGLRPLLASVEDDDMKELKVGDLDVSLRPGGWTPDGKYFVVHRHNHDDNSAWTELLDPETGTTSRLGVAFGRLSNDGTRMVGFLDFTGDARLCVMALPDGGCAPIAGEELLPDWEHAAGVHWSPDDKWIAVDPRDDSGWVLLDPEGGPPITPVWSERGIESWQRLAP